MYEVEDEEEKNFYASCLFYSGKNDVNGFGDHSETNLNLRETGSRLPEKYHVNPNALLKLEIR